MPRPDRILVVPGDLVPAFCQATLALLRDAERAGAEARAPAGEAAEDVVELIGEEAAT